MKRRFWGVNLGLAIGIIGLVSWISSTLHPMPIDPMEAMLATLRFWCQLAYYLTTTLGCIAYKSLKRRKLGLGIPDRARQYVELGLLIISGLVLYFPGRVFYKMPRRSWEMLIENEPVSVLLPFVALAWVVLAYVIMWAKQPPLSVNANADPSA